jgi:hypothetical protein
VTNNTTKVWIGYRIYSLWRFRAATHVTIAMTALALLASRILLSELHCTDVSLRGLTPSASEADWCRLTLCIVFPCQHRAGNNKNTGLPTVGYHATQQYRSGEHIHGIIRLRLPSNDGLQSDTSQYHRHKPIDLRRFSKSHLVNCHHSKQIMFPLF